jgi:Transcriptional regulatory protein, C terminal
MPTVRLCGFDSTMDAALVELLPQLGYSISENSPDIQLAASGEIVPHHSAPYVVLGGPEGLETPLALSALVQALQKALSPGRIPLGARNHADLAARTIVTAIEGDVITLTEKECALLKSLHERMGEPVSREDLLQEVWGYAEDIATHTLESHMHRLRSKLKEATGSDSCIQTTETGYSLVI